MPFHTQQASYTHTLITSHTSLPLRQAQTIELSNSFEHDDGDGLGSFPTQVEVSHISLAFTKPQPLPHRLYLTPEERNPISTIMGGGDSGLEGGGRQRSRLIKKTVGWFIATQGEDGPEAITSGGLLNSSWSKEWVWRDTQKMMELPVPTLEDTGTSYKAPVDGTVEA